MREAVITMRVGDQAIKTNLKIERRSSMKRHLVLIAIVVGMFIISLAASQSLQAQDTQIAVGLGVGLAPDYEGSEDYEAVPIPYVNVKWSNHMSPR
jgi:outer membrane scaffolding protein for murein synthesis (MipA/OmpV family)